jgi:hypothetical protein
MSGPFQHIVQRAFLERWKGPDGIYLIEKATGTVSRKHSARNILGMENMQTDAMENAFADVETCIGNTSHQGELTKPADIRLLAKWMALHFVRNSLNASAIGAMDYAPLVEKWTTHLAAHHATWMDVQGDVFITGDNPVVSLKSESETLYFASLSPRRCIYFIKEDKLPMEDGKTGFSPQTINWYVFKAASKYCVSFDNSLHIEDWVPPDGVIDDRD